MNTPAQYAEVAVIAREAGITMLERLDLVALKPVRILEVGCSVGFCTELLRQRYPSADIVAIDDAEAMLKYAEEKTAISAHWVCADAANLPVMSQKFDIVVANLLIPWCNDIKKLFQEWRRVLCPDGLLMFTSLGPDTLQELQPLNTQLPQLVDMHDLGDELVKAGFADPVLDVQHITLKYRKWEQLSYELQVTGMLDEPLPFNESVPLSLTYEIVYGHTWAPKSTEYAADNEGIVRIPLSHLRGR